MDRILRRLAEARPPDVPPRPARARPTGRRKALRLILLPATAAVAVAVAVVALNPAGPPRTDEHVTVAPPKSDARQFLLAAATKVETAQPATGRYFLYKEEWGSVNKVVGGYRVLARSTWEDWKPVSPQDKFIGCQQELGFQPATEADRAAWQRAGSPTTVEVEESGRRLTIEPGEPLCKGNSTVGNDIRPHIGNAAFTYEEIQTLPTEPAQLLEVLRGRLVPPSDPLADPRPEPERLFDAAVDILTRIPAPPALRAAAYRMLAGLPDLTLRDGVTDGLGRPGSAVECTIEKPGVPSEPGFNSWVHRLIIDLRTGQVLASYAIFEGHKENGGYNVVVSADLTDQPPPPHL